MLWLTGTETSQPPTACSRPSSPPRLVVQPGSHGEVGARVVGDDEHAADGTAGGVRQGLQVDLGRGYGHAPDGGDPGDVGAGHPGLRDRAHEQRAVDLRLGATRHDDDVGSQAVGGQVQALLGAVYDEHRGDGKGRDATGAQAQQPAAQLVGRQVAQGESGEAAEPHRGRPQLGRLNGVGLNGERLPVFPGPLLSSFLSRVMRPSATVAPPAATMMGRMVVLQIALLCAQTPISTVGRSMATSAEHGDEHGQGPAGLLRRLKKSRTPAAASGRATPEAARAVQ